MLPVINVPYAVVLERVAEEVEVIDPVVIELARVDEAYSVGVAIDEVAVRLPAVRIYAVAEVAKMVLAFSVPFVKAKVRAFRLIAVLADRVPPSVYTLVLVEKSMPFVAVDVENCDVVVRHVPFTEKQPLVRLSPLAKVDDADVDVMFSVFALSPEAKVDVPCPEDTVIAPPKVEVAVDVAMMLPAIVVPYRVVDARVAEEVEVNVPVVRLGIHAVIAAMICEKSEVDVAAVILALLPTIFVLYRLVVVPFVANILVELEF
jgi:hypothetical protein